MKKVYTHENRLLVGNARGLLEAQGIEVTMRNEYVSGVTGEVPVFETWPELWVLHDQDYDRACAILAEVFTPETVASEPWECPACREQNEASFEFCWSCGTDAQGLPSAT